MLDDVPARHNDPTPSRSDGSKAPAILSRQFQGPDHEIACYLPQSDLINLISASHQSEAAFVHNLQALRLTVPASLDLRVKVQQQPEHDQEALLAGLASLLLRCYAVQRLTVSQAHAVPSGGKRLVMLGGPTGRPCWVAPLAHAMGTGGMASLQSLEVLNALDMAESRVLCAALAQGCCPRLAQLTLGHERMHVGVVDTHALAAAVQRRRELGYVLPLRRLSMTLAVSDESGAQGLESLSSCCGGDLHELRLHVVLPVAAAQCTHATMAAIGTGLACLPRLRVLAVRTSVTLPCVLPTSSSAAPLVLYSALLPSYQPAVLSDGANRGNNNQQQQPPPLPSPPSPPSLSREHAMRLSSSLVQEGAWQDMAELDLQGMRLGDAEAGILLGAMGRTQHGMAQLRTLRLQLGPGGLKALARVMEAGGFPALRALHLVMWQPGGGRQEQMQQHMGEGWGAGLVAVAEALASGARCSETLETLELSALSADLTNRATRALAWAMTAGACRGVRRLLLSGMVEHSAEGVASLMECVRAGAGQAVEELGLPETLVGHGRAGDLLVAALAEPAACPALRRLSVHEGLVASASREARRRLIEVSQARGIQLQ